MKLAIIQNPISSQHSELPAVKELKPKKEPEADGQIESASGVFQTFIRFVVEIKRTNI